MEHVGVANNYTCYHQLYRLVPACAFTTVQQFHLTCFHTFYTCSTLYTFQKNFLSCNCFTFYRHASGLILGYNFIPNAVCCTCGMVVFVEKLSILDKCRILWGESLRAVEHGY